MCARNTLCKHCNLKQQGATQIFNHVPQMNQIYSLNIYNGIYQHRIIDNNDDGNINDSCINGEVDT